MHLEANLKTLGKGGLILNTLYIDYDVDYVYLCPRFRRL